MKELWNKYKGTIRRNCNLTTTDSEHGINYWRNSLFSTTIIMVLPLCLIAFIPSLVLITYENKEYITIIHILTIGVMCFIAFTPRVRITVRKLMFSSTVFIFTIMLNVFTSPSSGSVLVYFLAACIYSIIIFDNKYAYWWSHIVLFISILFGFAIYFELMDFSHNVDMVSVNEWAAVSSNLVFLCYLSSALIPQIFIGIENYNNEQKRLKTELEKNKTALEAKNKEFEQYAYVASHDLQEPLRMVSSFMNKLSTKYGDQLDDRAKMYMEYAENGAVQMKQIILDLLDFYRADKPSEQIELVDLNELLKNYLELRKETISDTSAKINYTTLPKIETIKPLITQVFYNILDNALKYTNKDTSPLINIIAYEQDTHWKFSVSDNGIGIDPQFFDKIFQLFQRLHNRNEYHGTGIGLSLVKRSIEFMGGKIWLESKLGVGSTFYFTIQKN
ncbi:sensor histidine kinase [Winogradskyella forsetii]|uniref:sensor histidine kinase n=1 Tax=Winogradskyella forsetii TaxID=2686077 RepID=UPI0015BC0C8E|nr:ATP-binding protein [Winogradskyella forsetii]